MPEINKLLLSLGSVVIGWLLSELGHYRRGRSAAKAAVGRALSELLEIRHYLRAINLVFREIRERLPLPPSEVLRGMVWIQHLMPADPKLPERFTAAVTEIAATHPLLAFELRSKDEIPSYLLKLRSLQVPESGDSPIQLAVDEVISRSLIDTLEKSIRELAFSHSFYTWWRIRKHLRAELTVPGEYQAILEAHLNGSKSASGQGSVTPTAQQTHPPNHGG